MPTTNGLTLPATEELPIQDNAEDSVATRRQALLRMSGYAVAVAPAMLVLMSGKGHAVPPCNVPAWQHGLKKKGHSGC